MEPKKLSEENDNKAYCKIESVISIDERGQMILPKEFRNKANIKAGDRLAVMYWEQNNKCCISLIKIDDLTGMVKDLLMPALRDILETS